MKLTIKRSFFVGALIFLQMVFLFAAVLSVGSQTAYIYSVVQVVDIVAVLVVAYGRDNPSYKLTWTVILLAFPLFGVLIYLIAGPHYLPRKLKKRFRRAKALNRRFRYQDPAVLEELGHCNELYSRQAKYILKNCDMPVYKHSSAELLTPGERMFAVFLKELGKARKFIFLEYFIISESRMWDSTFEILKQKAAEGVEIKILYDDMGSLDHISHGFAEKIRKAGIEVYRFNPFLPVLNKLMNYRDHRKITVIDGNVAFTGGINIGDEYINLKRPHGYWKDTSVVVRGEAVWSFTVMFLDMWQIVTGGSLDCEKYRPSVPVLGDGFVQPYDDSPADGVDAGESVYMQMAGCARRYLYIMTPYLIIDNETATSLCLAAMSGVDVRIITPSRADRWFVHVVTRSTYQRLMDSGVKIYEYMPGFLHSKVVLCDDEVSVVGTINYDYRSFFLQFECASVFYLSDVNTQIKEDFFKTFKQSHLIDPEQWKKRSGLTKFLEVLLNLFAPIF